VLQQPQGFSAADDELKSPVAAFHFEHGGPSVTHHAPPRGQHTEEILQNLGCSAEEISALKDDGVIA
jgi:crotonobetainyl-CoA:carnitine CoA-transferase CaiB-like acyl-CoA transferase